MKDKKENTWVKIHPRESCSGSPSPTSYQGSPPSSACSHLLSKKRLRKSTWEGGWRQKAEKGTPGVDLLCFHWKEPQPEFGNNPERKLLGKQDISCSCFFFNNISEKENKECITINRWTASTLNRALRGKWSLLRKETGQGESTHTTQEETVARWDTCYYKC